MSVIDNMGLGVAGTTSNANLDNVRVVTQAFTPQPNATYSVLVDNATLDRVLGTAQTPSSSQGLQGPSSPMSAEDGLIVVSQPIITGMNSTPVRTTVGYTTNG